MRAGPPAQGSAHRRAAHLVGTVHLASPRWHRCRCAPEGPATFSPLVGLLPERTTPELCHLQAKVAALVSFGHAAELLAEIFPLGRPLHATAVRRHSHQVAQRLEDELGPEQFSFIEGYPADRAELPRPDLPLTVGLDGGFVHSAHQTSRRDGWFEVIAGKSIPAEGRPSASPSCRPGTPSPSGACSNPSAPQGMQANQQVTFLTDGADDVRDLPLHLNPQAEHRLDWFHLTMRLTVMTQMAKSLRSPAAESLATRVAAELERLKWFCWHGNVFRALLRQSRPRAHHAHPRPGRTRPAPRAPHRPRTLETINIHAERPPIVSIGSALPGLVVAHIGSPLSPTRRVHLLVHAVPRSGVQFSASHVRTLMTREAQRGQTPRLTCARMPSRSRCSGASICQGRPSAVGARYAST